MRKNTKLTYDHQVTFTGDVDRFMMNVGKGERRPLTKHSSNIDIPSNIVPSLASDFSTDPVTRVWYSSGFVTNNSPLQLPPNVSTLDILASETAYMDDESIAVMRKRAYLTVLQRNCEVLEKTQKIINVVWWEQVRRCRENGVLEKTDDPEFESAFAWETMAINSKFDSLQKDLIQTLQTDITIFNSIKKV